MEISQKTISRLEKWAELYPLSLEQIKAIFEKNYTKVQADYPDNDEKFWEDRARFFAFKEVKGSKFSSASTLKGIILAYADEYDMTRSAREFALEAMKKDKGKAIKQGLIDENGTVLDNQEKFPWGDDNPNFGKPLENKWTRKYVALSRPVESDELKIEIGNMRDDLALEVPKLGVPYEYRVAVDKDEDMRRKTKTIKNTVFTETAMEELPVVDEGAICELLQNAPAEFTPELIDLMDWIEEHQDYDDLVIVEVDVMYVRPEPMSNGNYFLAVSDESLQMTDSDDVAAFVSAQLASRLDFGSGSKVLLIARPGTSNFYDRETKSVDTSKKVPVLNVQGIWALPDYRMPVDSY